MLKRLRAAYILTEEQFDEMVKPENLKLIFESFKIKTSY